MIHSIIKIKTVLFFVLSLVACRMSVIEPEPINIEPNRPNQENRLNFFNYELNAENYNTTSTIRLNFSVSRATMVLTLLEHSNGNVNVEIKDPGQSTVFKTQFRDNFPSYIRTINEPDQASMILSFENFSGKLRIRLSSTVE